MGRIPSIIDDHKLLEMVREGIAAGADTLYFRAGYLPLYSGSECADEIVYRQLTGDDLDAIAGMLLERAHVPERLTHNTTDAAQVLPLYCEIPGEALLEVRFAHDRGALAIDVEIARPRPRDLSLRALL